MLDMHINNVYVTHGIDHVIIQQHRKSNNLLDVFINKPLSGMIIHEFIITKLLFHLNTHRRMADVISLIASRTSGF